MKNSIIFINFSLNTYLLLPTNRYKYNSISKQTENNHITSKLIVIQQSSTTLLSKYYITSRQTQPINSVRRSETRALENSITSLTTHESRKLRITNRTGLIGRREAIVREPIWSPFVASATI